MAASRTSKQGGKEKPAARRVGRPRAQPRRMIRPPAEEILIVASRLFAREGFAGTSTRDIAAAAGLRQPSLFHYYPKKEAILEALLASTLTESTAFAEKLAQQPGRASVKLFRLLRFDVQQLCASPYDLTALLHCPELRQPRFRRWREQRRRLQATLLAFIQEGMQEGDFVPGDAAFVTRALFGLDEATLWWYQRNDPWKPDEVGEHIASLALRALLRDPTHLDRIKQEAQRLDSSETGL